MKVKGYFPGKHVTVRELNEVLERGFSFHYIAPTDTLIIEKGV